jgi:hypothetical protein
MYKSDHCIPNQDDKILEVKRYTEADELERQTDYDAMVCTVCTILLG